MVQYLHLMDGKSTGVMNEAEATANVHLFMGAVYLTPFLGALLADIFLGKYRTIIALSIVYCAGHAALAGMGLFGHSPWWLLAGLGLIALGSGGIKPCVSAHVGDQFGARNAHLLTQNFQLVLFFHQHRRLRLDAAHAVAARMARPALGVRGARRADGAGHAGVLAGAPPLHPRAGRRHALPARDVPRRRVRGDAQAAAALSVCGDVLGALRPDRLDLDLPIAGHGPAFPRLRVAALADPIAQFGVRAQLHPGLHVRGLSVWRPAVAAHAAAQDRPRAVHHGGIVRAGGHDPALDRRRRAA